MALYTGVRLVLVLVLVLVSTISVMVIHTAAVLRGAVHCGP